MRTLDGQLNSKGLKIAIVASRFNSFIVERLVEGALDAIARTGGSTDDVTVARCPGSFEIPQVARRLLEHGGIDAVVCLGCVIRGATPHFDLVVGEATRGIGALAAETGCAVGYGVLACDTIEQAIERAGTKAGNRGFDAAMVAIEMADLYARLDAEQGDEGGAKASLRQDLPRRSK